MTRVRTLVRLDQVRVSKSFQACFVYLLAPRPRQADTRDTASSAEGICSLPLRSLERFELLCETRLDSAFDRFSTCTGLKVKLKDRPPPSFPPLPTKQTLLSVNSLGSYGGIRDRSERRPRGLRRPGTCLKPLYRLYHLAGSFTSRISPSCVPLIDNPANAGRREGKDRLIESGLRRSLRIG